MSETVTPTPATSNAFARLLSELREGYTQQELSEALIQLTQSVRQTGKPGSLTFTVKMTPAKSSRAVTISDEIKVKLPEIPREETLMFSNDHYQLMRDDPQQRKLDLREVPKLEIKTLAQSEAKTAIG